MLWNWVQLPREVREQEQTVIRVNKRVGEYSGKKTASCWYMILFIPLLCTLSVFLAPGFFSLFFWQIYIIILFPHVSWGTGRIWLRNKSVMFQEKILSIILYFSCISVHDFYCSQQSHFLPHKEAVFSQNYLSDPWYTPPTTHTQKRSCAQTGKVNKHRQSELKRNYITFLP